MLLPQKFYDVIKYVVLIAIPAFCTAYLGIDSAVDLPYETQVVKVAAVVATLLGSLVGLSALQYNNSDAKYDGVIDPVTANTQTSDTALSLHTDEYDAANQKDLILKVKQHDPLI